MKPKEIDLGFKINEEKVMALDLPVEEMLIADLMNNAEICYLEKEGTDDWNLSPAELIKNFETETTHAGRVDGVDLSFPIVIYCFHDQWIILDGVHRFTKALIQKSPTIKVKKLPESLLSIIK